MEEGVVSGAGLRSVGGRKRVGGTGCRCRRRRHEIGLGLCETERTERFIHLCMSGVSVSVSLLSVLCRCRPHCLVCRLLVIVLFVVSRIENNTNFPLVHINLAIIVLRLASS